MFVISILEKVQYLLLELYFSQKGHWYRIFFLKICFLSRKVFSSNRCKKSRRCIWERLEKQIKFELPLMMSTIQCISIKNLSSTLYSMVCILQYFFHSFAIFGKSSFSPEICKCPRLIYFSISCKWNYQLVFNGVSTLKSITFSLLRDSPFSLNHMSVRK